MIGLNDFWEYSAGQWKWVSGSDTLNVIGSYGIQGTAAADNVPGSRYGQISWLDASDHLWLFGGDRIRLGGYRRRPQRSLGIRALGEHAKYLGWPKEGIGGERGIARPLREAVEPS